MANCCATTELRRYRLRPGKRDALIDLFDREFVETQDALGMQVIGQFRDLDEPDHFVWPRVFRNMDSRAKAVEAFYGGPVWAKYLNDANGTMISWDNVPLLRPASADCGFVLPENSRSTPGASGRGTGLMVSTNCHLAPNQEAAFAEFSDRALKPLLTKTSATVLSTLATESGPNTFPKLPVCAGETVFVWFSGLPSQQVYDSNPAQLNCTEA